MSSQNNNVPEGFKMTEIGLLPDEWETTKLGDLFEIKQGKALSPEHRRGISPRPFLRTANVFWGYLDLTTVDSMDFTDAEVSQLKLMPNDLLVCEGGDIGRTAIWWDESKVCCYQNHLHRLRTSRGDVRPLFYMYWMQAAHLLLRLYGGTGNKTTIPNLSQSRLKSFVLPLPPLPEQTAIARVLSTIQKSIETQDKIIAAARELKKSLMRHLFTYGPVPVAEAEKVPLKETEIGPVPEHWEQKELDEVCDITYGVQAAVANLTDSSIGIPILTNINIRNEGMLDISTLRYYPLPDSRRDRLILKKGDVLFNWRSGSPHHVGKTAIFDLDGDCTFSSFILRFRANVDNISNQYLFRYMNFLKGIGFFTDKRSQSSVNSVFNASLAAKIPVFLPTASDQTEIVVTLASADRKLEIEANRKAALQTLFQTMLHNLMSGKVRVNHLEATVS